MKLQRMCVFLAALIPLLSVTAGCGNFFKKEVGMVVVYEIVAGGESPGAKPSEADIEKTVAVLQRRLNPGGVELGRVRKLEDGRAEVRIFRDEPERMERLAELLLRPGTMELRILANQRDHKASIERAARVQGDEVQNADGKRTARWVPVQEEADLRAVEDDQIATRKRMQGGREVVEVLVAMDPFNVTGEHLKRAHPSVDRTGKPSITVHSSSEGSTEFRVNRTGKLSITVEFSPRGGKLLGALTGDNLPDPADGFARRLGIILDGELVMAPSVRSTISNRAEISGHFTEEEILEWADLLNAGSLPVPIREVSRREVAPGGALSE